MARERRRRSRTAVAEQPNFFSRLVPDVVERPLVGAATGTTGFVGNLLTDVKDAAIGLPMGLVTAVQHPQKAAKAILSGTWQTWSPLFHGKPVAFAKQVYDHPLAPILDVASVFTLGAGTAARGAAALEKAGSTSATVSKVAKLRSGGTQVLKDPTGKGRADMEKVLSRRAGRRIVQNGLIAIDDKLPQFYQRGRYNRAHLVDMAHRSVTAKYIEGEALRQGGMRLEKAIADGDREYMAVRLQAEAALQGAEGLEDLGELGKRMRSTIVAHMHTNLIRHNKAYTDAEAVRLVEGNKHYTYAVDPAYADRAHHALIGRLERAHSRTTRQRGFRQERNNAELRRLTERLEKQLDEAAYQVAPSGQRMPLSYIEKEIEKAEARAAEIAAKGNEVYGPPRTLRGGRPILRPTQKQLARMESEPAWEVQERIKMLRAKREAALAAKAKAEETQLRIETLRADNEAWDRKVIEKFDQLEGMKNRATEDYFKFAGESYEAFSRSVSEFGKLATTRNIAHAMRDQRGRVYVVPKHDAYQLGLEGGNSINFLHKLLHKPTQVWKTAVVGYSPRTVTNNGVGNWFMYAVREAPSANGVLAIRDAMRARFGSVIDGEPLFERNHFIHRYFSDEYADNFGIGNQIVRLGEDLAASKKARLKHFARSGFYPAVYKTSEAPLRAATIYKALRDMPEVQAEIRRLKGTGKGSVDRAIENVLRKRPDLRDEAAARSRQLAGDYITMSEGEKWARDIIPFYLWSRHILKNTGNMFADTPARLAAGQQLSLLGVEETEELLGELPDFLKGAIPLQALGFGDNIGRANVMLTASLNPYATVGEIAESVSAFVSGNGRRGAAASQLNPFLQGGIESITETSLLSGTHSPREGGLLGDVLSRSILNLPQVKLADEWTKEDTALTPKGNEYLYARDDLSPGSSFLGIPIRNVSLKQAEALRKRLDDEVEAATGRARRRRGRD